MLESSPRSFSQLLSVIQYLPDAPLAIYRIYLNRSRAHINGRDQISAGVKHSKENKRLCKM